MKALLGIVALLTIGCAAMDPETPEAGGLATCHNGRLGDLAGRPWTEAIGRTALRRSGARSLRRIRPGDAVTMDFRGDGLNVHIDRAGRIERFVCG